MALVIVIRVSVSPLLREELTKRGVFLAQVIARDSTDFILTGKIIDLQLLMGDYRRSDQSVAYIYSDGPDGAVLSHTFGSGFPVELAGKNIPQRGMSHSIKALNIEGEIILDIAVPLLEGELGTTHVGLSEREIREDAIRITTLIMGILGAVLIAGGGLSLALTAFITMPLANLREMADRVGKGDYEFLAPVRTRDEIGQLGKAFNRMVAEVRQTNDTQKVINSLLRVSLAQESLESILSRALELLLAVRWLGLENKGAIFLVKKNSEFMQLQVQVNLPEQIRRLGTSLPAGRCLCGRDMPAGQLHYADTPGEPHETGYPETAPHGHYAIPIVYSGKTLGVINLYLHAGTEREDRKEQFLTDVAGALAIIIRHRRTEKERENLVSRLQTYLDIASAARRQWLLTFDHITDMIVIIDSRLRVVRANKAFAQHFERTPAKIANKEFQDLPDGARSIFNSFLEGETFNSAKPVAREIFDAGKNKLYSISSYPYRDPEFEFKGVVILARDITEEKEKEVRLVMSERLASLGEIASGIAHEINNPLASIAGCAGGMIGRMKKGHYSPELFSRYLEIVLEEVARCKKITSTMLSFVRDESYASKELNINEVLAKTLEIIGFQGRLKNVTVVADYADQLPMIHGSEGDLRQVFMAIITNALDAIENSGALGLGTAVEGGRVVIRISDSGPGIPEDLREKIFTPFFTTKSSSGGTGLGLTIAKKILDEHRGSIEIVTQDSQDNMVILTLPA